MVGVDPRPDRTKAEHERALFVAPSRAHSQLVVVAEPAQLRAAELYLLAGRFKPDAVEEP